VFATNAPASWSSSSRSDIVRVPAARKRGPITWAPGTASQGLRCGRPAMWSACDVVGLYVNPPAQNAIVLSADEKSQVQARQQTAPILSLRPGLSERDTHDHVRLGATTLFAPLEVATARSPRPACRGTGTKSSCARAVLDQLGVPPTRLRRVPACVGPRSRSDRNLLAQRTARLDWSRAAEPGNTIAGSAPTCADAAPPGGDWSPAAGNRSSPMRHRRRGGSTTPCPPISHLPRPLPPGGHASSRRVPSERGRTP